MRYLIGIGAVGLMVGYVFIPSWIEARPEGITGVSTTGCTCHAASPSSNVIVSINGPAELAPSETATYTLTVTGGPLAAAGTNISATGGSLTPGEGMQKIGSELTHTSPKSPVSGNVTFSFTFTAPSAAGSATIRAAANSVNLSGDNTGDQWNFAPSKSIMISPTSFVGRDESSPFAFSLDRNYPNPFNPSTRIPYRLASSGETTLKIFSADGKEVATLVRAHKEAGSYEAVWETSGMPSGVYIARLAFGGKEQSRKLVLMK